MFATSHQNTTKTENTTTDLAEIIREETDDGRLLVRVLTEIVEGKIEDTKPHHRIAAIKELHRQRREQASDHSCGCDDKNGVPSAASTTDEELDKPPDNAAGPDQPSEIAPAPKSETDSPTGDTHSAALVPEQSREEVDTAEPDPDQHIETTDSVVPEPDQSREEPNTADLNPGPALEIPHPANLPFRRPRLTRRERRRQKRKSSKIPGPRDNDRSDTRFKVDSVVSAGFR